MGIIAWIVFGLAAALLANLLIPGHPDTGGYAARFRRGGCAGNPESSL